MADNISLSSIFAATKDDLAASLFGLVLPKDVQSVQEKIASYLNEVCSEDNEFRQNLTQSEDYILQAALSMLNAQRNMVYVLSQAPKIETTTSLPGSSQTSKAFAQSKTTSISASAPNALLGSGGGALIGKLVLGGWGAVFGAIAGTALVLYMAQQKSEKSTTQTSHPAKQIVAETITSKIIDVPVDEDALLSVIEQLCDSLDNLINTFRAQVRRVVNKYESIEKPTIEREYRVLLEGIQSLLGYKRGHSATEDKYVGKLQERIEDLAELLDNYDLEAVDYAEINAQWFDAIESEKATEIKLVAPAITKKGTLVIKGKVFIPKKNIHGK